MTDEDAFHAALDADPSDSLTRRAFADWLEERDDPRAAGYRALGVLGKRPGGGYREFWHFFDDVGRSRPRELPTEWIDAMNRLEDVVGRPKKQGGLGRRYEEDLAALAFARLTPEQQAAILSAAEVPA